MGRVHIGLNFKNHAREFFLVGMDYALYRFTVRRWGRQVHQRI